MNKQTNKLHIAMLTDAWFPSSIDGPGEFSGLQVHVNQLRQNLEKYKNCKVELFFPANPNCIIRWLWSFVVIFQVFSYHRNQPLDIIHAQGSLSTIPAKILSIFIKVPVWHQYL